MYFFTKNKKTKQNKNKQTKQSKKNDPNLKPLKITDLYHLDLHSSQFSSLKTGNIICIR